MKYKVGDKVKVRSDLVEDSVYGDNDVVSEMLKFLGNIMTIKQVDEQCYYLEEDDERWCWTDEMLEEGLKTETIGEVDDDSYLAVHADVVKRLKDNGTL